MPSEGIGIKDIYEYYVEDEYTPRLNKNIDEEFGYHLCFIWCNLSCYDVSIFDNVRTQFKEG